MGTSISNEIIKVLDALCDKFGIAIDWSSENILPYLSTLMDKCISYEISTSIYWIFLAFVIGCIGLCCYKQGKNLRIRTEDHEGYLIYLIGWGGLIASPIIIASQLYDLIKCYTLPELIIIEQINHTINLLN